MTDNPDKAFILAAGKGTRLRPHTDTMPKPMVEINGISIIRRTLAKLADAGVRTAVVNLHHLAPILHDHLENTPIPHIVFSHEDELLETGGGIKRALANFNGRAFYIINGDALWRDRDHCHGAIKRLADRWDNDAMDILLLLQPKSAMPEGFVGDYHVMADGRAVRATDRTGDYMFAGIRIAHPRIFEGSPDGAFSFLELMDKAERAGRLYAVVHDAEWYHISTPEDLTRINAEFERLAL